VRPTWIGKVTNISLDQDSLTRQGPQKEVTPFRRPGYPQEWFKTPTADADALS